MLMLALAASFTSRKILKNFFINKKNQKSCVPGLAGQNRHVGQIHRKQIELRPVVLREFNFAVAFVLDVRSVTLNFRHGISFFI